MRFLFVPIILFFSISLSAQLDFSVIQQEKDSITLLRIGTPFPDFTTTSLDGKPVGKEQLTGKITIINFWYQSCAPCIAEFDALNDLYDKFKDNSLFQFLSFTFDPEENAKETVRKFNISYDVFSLVKKECLRLIGNGLFPTSVIVDQTGRIAFIKEGGAIDKQGAAAEVQKMELLIAYLLMQNNDTSKYTYSVFPLLRPERDIPDSDANMLLQKYMAERVIKLQSKIGTLYPEFTATSLAGKTISEKQLAGKVTIINFWFETCAPCIAEFDALNKLFHRFEGNPSFQFLSFTNDPEESARKTILKYSILYDVLPVERSECSRLNFGNGFPTTIILNRAGQIVSINSGGFTDNVKVTERIQEFEKIIADTLEE
jgi:cytochrome oxidase Cu insertion factor (SCO1/SenC/PrrC family)